MKKSLEEIAEVWLKEFNRGNLLVRDGNHTLDKEWHVEC